MKDAPPPLSSQAARASGGWLGWRRSRGKVEEGGCAAVVSARAASNGRDAGALSPLLYCQTVISFFCSRKLNIDKRKEYISI